MSPRVHGVVTVAGQTLNATVTAGGAWQVTAATLTDGPHQVVASSTDAANNTGTATQTLTVATATPPGFIAIDGGSSATTSDSTPTITGTTSEPVGSTVTVTAGGQTLTTPVTAGKVWSVTLAALADGVHQVTASVTRPGSAPYTATQALTVNTVTPPPPGFIAIDGGSSATTSDSTPTITGTTSEPVGSTVTVTVEGQTLTTLVTAGKVWSVTLAALADGVHQVTASITRAGSAPYTATQALTVNTVTPPPPGFIAIDGGDNAATPTRPQHHWYDERAGRFDGDGDRRGTDPHDPGDCRQRLDGDARALADGVHQVTASITRAGSAPYTDTQALTVSTPTLIRRRRRVSIVRIVHPSAHHPSRGSTSTALLGTSRSVGRSANTAEGSSS